MIRTTILILMMAGSLFSVTPLSGCGSTEVISPQLEHPTAIASSSSVLTAVQRSFEPNSSSTNTTNSIESTFEQPQGATLPPSVSPSLIERPTLTPTFAPVLTGTHTWVQLSEHLKDTLANRLRLVLERLKGPSLASGTQVWVERSTVKVRPSASPKEITEGNISAAKNEFESFQIVVRSSSGIQNITPQASSLSGPGGEIISASAIRFYRVELMAIDTPSDVQGGTGRWPDPLIPMIDDLDGSPRAGFPFDAAANDARAIWVEVLVPSDAVAGIYYGQITLHGIGIEGYEVPVSLQVYDFKLPSTPTLHTYYQLNDLSVCSGHYHGDASCGDWGDQKMNLIDKYARFALDHRITLGNIYYQRPNGNDWSEFDRRYAPLLDGAADTRLAGAELTSANYMLPLDAESLASYQKHFVAKGWMDRAFDYTADEPGYGSSWSSILERTELVHSHAPKLKTLVTTTIGEAASHGLDDDIDIIVPLVNFVDEPAGGQYVGNQSVKYNSYQAAGKTVWMYQSCMSHDCGGAGAVGAGTAYTGYPSLAIDHSALRNRAMEWVAFNFGATGDLYWETTFAYQGDPWSSQYYFTGNGDGTLFYPGTPEKVGGSGQTPIASQRLKMLRDSVEDYEYLSLLTRLGDSTFAHNQAHLVAPTAYSIGDDATQLETSRNAIANRIEELVSRTTR